MFLDEWLKKVGFSAGHPFALKQADEEGELLQAYFVEHPAYVATLDAEHPRSSILHAPRGSGKSTTRRMFEEYCTAHAESLRPLIIPLLDWQPIIERFVSASPTRAQPHIHEIFCRAVVALAQDTPLEWLKTPASPDLNGYLHWICHTYDQYLTPNQRRSLSKRGWRQKDEALDITAYDMNQLPIAQRLEILVQILQAMGYRTCYILIDRIDELLETVAEWEVAANLLAPLVGNLRLVEIPGLAFKYFIPTEVVSILQQRHILREDRIGCFGMQWDDVEGQRLLEKMLRSRLTVFSDGQVRSLASIAISALRDIDEQLSAAALGSPRHLLNLGEWLFQACATDADDDHLFIQPAHLAIAEAQLQSWIQRQPAGTKQSQPAPRPALEPSHSEDGPVADTGAANPPPTNPHPLLHLKEDGSIWRGERPIENWQDLPDLQRTLLQYLYLHRGKLCRKKDILAHVWPDYAVGDDSLRKLVARLTAFIEPDPEHPIYLQKIHGGHLRLDNAG